VIDVKQTAVITVVAAVLAALLIVAIFTGIRGGHGHGGGGSGTVPGLTQIIGHPSKGKSK